MCRNVTGQTGIRLFSPSFVFLSESRVSGLGQLKWQSGGNKARWSHTELPTVILMATAPVFQIARLLSVKSQPTEVEKKVELLSI